MQATQTAGAVTPRAGGRFKVFTALRHRNYRYYWFGMVAAILGLQVLMVAQAWLVYDLTRSPAYLGLVGFSQALPTVLLTMIGGAVADRVDRRKLLLFTQSSNSLIVLALAILTSTGQIQVWHVIAAALLAGVILAFDQPARMALVPQLIERADLMNAVALQSMVWQGTRIVGPAIGGLLISRFGGGREGVAACFYLAAAFTGIMVAALVKLRVLYETPETAEKHLGRNMVEGVAFIAKNRVFASLIGLTFFDSIFGLSYVILLPVFAREVLHVESLGYGFLMGISGVGALVGTTFVASLGDYRYKGRLLLVGAVCFGVTLVLFSFSRIFVLSLGVLFVSGVANSLYMTTVNTSLQALVPDQLRGRVMGIYSLTWGLLPMGGMVGGTIATVTSAPFAVAVGGTLVVAMALGVAVKIPQIRNL